MTKEIIDTTNKLIKPGEIPSSENAVIQQLSKNLQGITPEDVNTMCNDIEEAEKKMEIFEEVERKKMKGKEKEEKIERIRGNTDAILDDLRENHVKIEEAAEMMGYKGKKVHIDLPAIGNFEGFKFDYFVSDVQVSKYIFEMKSELIKKSYSMSEILKLLQMMNKYMAELGGKNDGTMNYILLLTDRDVYRCNAGDCLKAITGLNDHYWLSDNDLAGNKSSRGIWYCGGCCDFGRTDYITYDANTLLRLSD